MPAEAFLARGHGAVTRSNGHGADLPAVLTLLAEIRPNTEWKVHVPVLAPANEADRPGPPDFCADTYATPAQYAGFVAERVADLGDATAYGNVLDGSGIWSLGYQ